MEMPEFAARMKGARPAGRALAAGADGFTPFTTSAQAPIGIAMIIRLGLILRLIRPWA
jgi:hypothetical protein